MSPSAGRRDEFGDHREVLGLTVGEQAFWTEFLRSPRSVACTASAWRRCRVP
ncbi:hypothetical protein AB0F17_02235 [Nonomuraea sp. NPDC026600]|uniref:hypothetical protein n=1 Tax=Nonomuraea sp. NPDC026600 TaxID=3155363 RepID=UPI0033C3EE56